MKLDRYRVLEDGSHIFYTFKNSNFNKDIWLENTHGVLNDSGEYYRWYNEDGTVDFEKEDVLAKALDIENNNSLYSKAVYELTKDTPKDEQATWTKQEAQARAWLVDPLGEYILIRGIANKRGVPLDILVAKIIEKSNKLEELLGDLTGLRQKAEDEL